jgi:hypothetical protein
MSHAPNNHEAALRRALHAAADQIEPAEDGLERIQARLRHPRPFPVAWAEALRVHLSLRTPDALAATAARAAHELRQIGERFMPDPDDREAARGGRLQLGWLRPLAAMGTAVFIVAAVVYMANKVPQVISPTGNAASAVHTGGPSPRAGQSHGSGQTLGNGKSGSPSPSHQPSSSPNAQSCSPSSQISTLNPEPKPSTSVLTTPPTSSSPTSSSPTTSASPTPTPTPTDSSSTTPTGAGTTPSSGSVGTPAPSDVSQTPSARTDARRAGHALAKDTGLARTVAETSTPCTSPSPKASKRSSSRKVISPEAGGQLELRAGGPALAPADVRSRLG